MELGRLRKRLALIDSMLDRMDPNADRVQYLRRTVYVLRRLLSDGAGVPSAYGPATPIARFSIQ